MSRIQHSTRRDQTENVRQTRAVQGGLQSARTRPLLLGHRGARSLTHFRLRAAKPNVPPENTLASFEYALASGCDGFEFDVRATRDGKLAICHNAWVRGHKVDASSFESLCSRCRTTLPCLQDVLRGFGNRAYLDIEVKASGCETNVVEAIRQHRPISRYMVSSFLPQVLRQVHHLDHSVPLGYVCNRAVNLPIWRDLPIKVFLPHHLLITKDLVDRVH